MLNLKEIRTRIGSVTSTMQITNAMKMVSAARLRRAQDSILQLRPYVHKLRDILTDMVSGNNEESGENVYMKERSPEKILLVPVTANKGLCGAFNSNVFKKATDLAETRYKMQMRNGSMHFYSIGKKGTDLLRYKNYPVYKSETGILDDLSYHNAIILAEELMDLFISGKYDRIILIYNQFKNAAVQILSDIQYLPVIMEADEEEDYLVVPPVYIFEPSKELIVKDLMPRCLRIMVFEALLDSIASELGARMTSMHKATENAEELLKDLRLTYNKARQATITREIVEIVGGAEALGK